VPDLSPPTNPALLTGPAPPDEVDPELLALPDPPRRERSLTLILLAVTALASFAMASALRGDASYALTSSAPLDLGDLRDVPACAPDVPCSFSNNRYVHAHGMLGAAGAIRYERPFESDTYRISPMASRRDLWVEVRVPAGEESARYVPPTTFDGRLVHFDASGPRHRGLAKAIHVATGEDVPPGAWVIVDGERPSTARWAVALFAMFLGFALWNVAALAKLVRRVR
jgi:hypothetical protein